MKWLGQALITGPHMALALSERDFLRAHKQLRLPRELAKPWIASGDATTHMYSHREHGLACIVCLAANEQHMSGIQIAGLLVHEAVHVFQFWREEVGEVAPSSEFEAYAIQRIAQRLMESYAQQSKVRP